jgi:predicted AAA+ superfamily ATPase
VPSEQEASHRFAGQRHCTIQTELEKIKTVTGEQYKHIIYYPIFDIQDESRIIAVFEVAYKRRLSSSENLLTEEIQSYLDQFRSQLDQFRVRLGSFTRNL